MSTQFLLNVRGRLTRNHLKNFVDIQKRNVSTTESIERRNELFNAEQVRQRDAVGRIEKIDVHYVGNPKNATLVMNKNISTPYNCAQHFSETHTKHSALALLNGKTPWDMHRPLQESCTLELLNFKVADPMLVNQAFWRSCSFLLGAVMQRTFKSEAGLILHSFPRPNVKSGSYVHDIALNEKNWQPSEQDLRALRIDMVKLALDEKKIERLEVNHEIAVEMFKDNPFKSEQLPSISNKNNGIVTLYRVGDHIDISRGPLIASTRFVGITKIAAVHNISQPDDSSNIYRVQGVSLPNGFKMSSFAFGILEERAKKLNQARWNYETQDTQEDHQNQQQQHDVPILQQKAN